MYENYKGRIEEILSKLTLREKIGQLNQEVTPTLENLEALKEAIRRGEVGSIIMANTATAGNDAQNKINSDFYNEIQRIAVEESPNGIPLIYGRDVIHGHRTCFPIPLAQAAAFNSELVEKSYSDIAEEATAESVHWTFTPMLDVSRDPRWGRIIEGPGEDPYVGQCVAKAVVKGLQGDDVSKEEKMLACAKHFIGYGASEGGRDYHRTEISNYSLFNYYLPAFRAAVEAGALTVMSSFNDINGQPVTTSEFYLKEVLRDMLGFEGFVVSDWESIKQLIRQGVAENDADCARLSIKAGLDMDMVDRIYITELEKLAANDPDIIEKIDESVRRILYVKLKKGLFERPYCSQKPYDKEKHMNNALNIARESIVLLKNEKNVLPLKKEANIALVGPFVDEKRSLLGSWTLDADEEDVKCFREAFCERAEGNVRISSYEGLGLDNTNKWINYSDTVVLALGESWTVTGENRSLSNISLSPSQKQLIKLARSSGKKTVGVIFCGRPIAMDGVAENLDAVVYAWHNGTKTADAVCDVLFGDIVPSGKLPATLPKEVGHVPLYYNVTSSGKYCNCYYGENAANCYVDSIPTPAFPFGFGLSYTQFKYSGINVEEKEIPMSAIKNGTRFKFAVEVENIGEYTAKETVQLYIRDMLATIMRPLRELKAFNKVLIEKGTKKTVEFEIGFDELGYYDDKGNYTIEEGKFEIYIGSDCLTTNKTTIQII